MENLNGVHIIDCTPICKPLREIQDTNEFKTFSEQFGNGMKLNGIVYLINTEVENEVISNFEQKQAEFYSLPFDVKSTYSADAFSRSEYGWGWGWKGPNNERLRSTYYTRETFDFTSNPRFEDDAMYPKEVIGFKDSLITCRQQIRNLSTKLLRSLGEFLQLEDKDFFIHKHRAFEENYALSRCSMRTLFYPKEPEINENAIDFRLPEHQDFGTLSLLYQNSQGGGLQAILNTGEYVDVEYIPNSFVVNAGRSLEMWCGGNIPAVLHRVAWTERSKTEDRYSFGLFLAPDRDVCCLPQIEENPDWKPIYEKMQPNDLFDEYFKRQYKLANEKGERNK